MAVGFFSITVIFPQRFLLQSLHETNKEEFTQQEFRQKLNVKKKLFHGNIGEKRTVDGGKN